MNAFVRQIDRTMEKAKLRAPYEDSPTIIISGGGQHWKKDYFFDVTACQTKALLTVKTSYVDWARYLIQEFFTQHKDIVSAHIGKNATLVWDGRDADEARRMDRKVTDWKNRPITIEGIRIKLPKRGDPAITVETK